ncbi:MAG: exodeoxyribonuclease VII large subunit [Oscillospiraceae bacterium]|nr:exodeoxyribonuclease VII large subunit [Oscillospiraceae bacterium]
MPHCVMLTVTELNQKAAEIIRKNPKLRLLLTEGEIANLRTEEHLFFSLCDAESSVRAVMFRHLAERLRFIPQNGMKVIAAGNADIYESNGMFQFRVTDMLLQSIGSIQKGFSEQEKQFSEEGIFSDTIKKSIPENPHKIGIITSASGAALQDILHILKRRSPSVETLLFPVHVQGKYAEAEICHALESADTQDCDVLLLGRGGGSSEDLRVFNSEKIVRAVHACKTPVISAVGHETDFTLTDRVADLRASTPSAAAELATRKHYPEILSDKHTIISSVSQIQTGDCLKIHLPDGIVTVRAEYKEKKYIMNESQKNRLKNYAERVENQLSAVTAEMQNHAESRNLQMPSLFDAMRHSLTAGGKRIRPALIYAFCEACGGTPEQADASACAMEMTHTASLIFDDLPALDNDDLRRGKPSCHKAFGEATAILAGYGLICAPFSMIAEDNALTPEQKTEIIKILAREEGTSGMVGGQVLDMQFEAMKHVTAEQLENMCLGKTGALMKAACQMGCLCGKGTPEQIETAGNYGLALGLAFQIIDDILDVTSTSEQLGKPVGSDAQEDKQTFVTVLGIENAKKRAEELTSRAHEELRKLPDSEVTEFLHALTDAMLVRVR